MEPVLTWAMILRVIYLTLGFIAIYYAHGWHSLRRQIRKDGYQEDHEYVKITTKMFKWWSVSVWVACIILLFT